MGLFRNKKGVLDIGERWVELGFLVLLVIGFIISILLGSAFFSYIVIFLSGMMFGRMLQIRKSQFPYYIIVLGFLLGYILGTRYGNWKIILFLFILGTILSFYLHEKKIIR